MPPLVLRKIVLGKLTTELVFNAFNKCMQKNVFVYFHCSLLLEFEPSETGNV